MMDETLPLVSLLSTPPSSPLSHLTRSTTPNKLWEITKSTSLSEYSHEKNDAINYLTMMNGHNIDKELIACKDMKIDYEYIVYILRVVQTKLFGLRVVADIRDPEDDKVYTIFLPSRYCKEIFMKTLPLSFKHNEMKISYGGELYFKDFKQSSVKLTFRRNSLSEIEKEKLNLSISTIQKLSEDLQQQEKSKAVQPELSITAIPSPMLPLQQQQQQLEVSKEVDTNGFDCDDDIGESLHDMKKRKCSSDNNASKKKKK